MITEQKTKALKSAKQSLGTLNRVIEMISTDTYCPEIIQQLDSVTGLLKKTKRELLTGHLDSCLIHKLEENKERTIGELLKIYNLSN